MTYYLCITGQHPIPIASSTLGGKFLAGEGWEYLKALIENGRDFNVQFEIRDQKNRKYHISDFLDKVANGGIIENE